MSCNIFWFRNDLRLVGNPGLAAALAAAETTVLVYVLDDDAAGAWAMGGASRWWLHHSLQSLRENIAARGGKLLLRRGQAAKIIPELAAEVQAGEVYASRRFEPWAQAQTDTVDAGLKSAGVRLNLHLASHLFAPERITTKTGGVYGVYTPFSRACFEQPPPARPMPAPARLAESEGATDRLDAWQLLPARPDWASGLRDAWVPGEAGAAIRLQAFITRSLTDYNTKRNLPAQDGTSGLSPHLHFGEISPAALWHAALDTRKPSLGLDTFLRELIWREFSSYLLWHNPAMPAEPLRPEFAKFPWADDAKSLQAWQRGQTGIPIVDAGMRQLWQTGWMHNRIRMVCASFLVKHLLIPWQQGEAWFWDTLVDADLGSNSNNWQWVAGCGADAAPYFRIFNPVLQGLKFDPAGAYVRRYVPELGGLPDKFIHGPWEADAAALEAANLVLGKNYPEPIIGLAEGRERALAAFKNLGKKEVLF